MQSPGTALLAYWWITRAADREEHSFGVTQGWALVLSLSGVQNKTCLQYPDNKLVVSKLLYKTSNRTFVSIPGTKFRNGNSSTPYCKIGGGIFKNLIGQHIILTGAVRSLLSLISVSSCHLINPLNAELNPICHLLALLGAHPVLHISRVRVNCFSYVLMKRLLYGPKESEYYDQQLSLIIKFVRGFVVTDFNMKFGSTQQFSYL